MKRPKIALVQIPPAARPAVLEAARDAFAGAEISESPSVREALARPASDLLELLVVDSSAADLPEALQARTAAGEPRWTVIALGTEAAAPATSVSLADWNAPLLAHVFRQAIAQLELRRENARLRGDLKTIARRISHDLRSPVGSIHTSADVLRELTAADTETMHGMADIVKQSSGEISQMVDRISLLLMATATDPAAFARVDMSDVVANVMHQLENPIEAARAKITLPPTWPEARGVAPWLAVVWTNFFHNALQHAGPSPHVQLAWEAQPAGFRFSITDGGPGVAAARVGVLFSRFDQLHSQRVPGLGLAIVQRLVALQGGTCSYEKPAAGGASFHFTLPAAS